MKDGKYAKSSGAGTLSDANSGPTRGGKGSPKSSTDGKSTSGDATNKIATLGCNPKEMSPSSTSMSKNTHGGSKRKY